MVDGGVEGQEGGCGDVHPWVEGDAPEEGPRRGHEDAQRYQLLRPEPVREEAGGDGEEELAEGGYGHDEADLLVGEAELLPEDREEGGSHVPGWVDQGVGEDHDEEAGAD